MRGDLYQTFLVILGLAVTILFGVFFYREVFPEYRIYQDDYIALEEFRSSYTGEDPPPFKTGVKQLVFENKNKGPEEIDRCISCHVALEFEHFSPSKIAHDASGKMEFDSDGVPIKIPNENYIWNKLEEKIAELQEQKPNDAHIDGYKSLMTAKVGDQVYDVKKVLMMHPLMGKETRPFEYHPIEEYGCTVCHNGNGRGLTTDKAHGPIFDEMYEPEFMGPTPKFLEKDEENDPRFSKIFNDKPGHQLLFQTTPLFIGSLMEAKCVQCHKTNGDLFQKNSNLLEPKQFTSNPNDLNRLTQNYKRGQELFISQACYACHRITGLSRGGVGPELTEEGKKYPWFIKESIVWPQADLKTSTMPNYRLDHDELEDLTTFLLAQRGRKKADSEIDHIVAIQEWEKGNLPNSWERQITPLQMQSLDYAMEVFAIEGCASCHRLKGFESNVGYAIEKKEVDFPTLYNEKLWFRNLFPEEIRGSEIVEAIEKNTNLLNEKLADDVRENSILEKIQSKHPLAIEALYSNFKYASRAKNNKTKEVSAEWKSLVNKILMIYIQEYGLGRIIGPRPNWSGVYRTDEWLMEHFKNPASHVARSIMPVFPFTDNKFYALTHMLDVLGVKNRDAVRDIWKNFGFNPKEAFNIHCSQCHGEYLQGNGPVTEWIYPIPKNLRNADFLRNLTKEKAHESIVHGIKGTPMPPWGETGDDKSTYDGIPVLTSQEIAQIVEWIYSLIPGSKVIKTEGDVPKWNYKPEDIIDEIKREGGNLKSEPEKNETLTYFSNGEDFYADTNPKVYKQHDKKVLDYFDVTENPIKDGEKFQYYLKKKYYTAENIKAGEKYFELNCAVCHGKEGDGTGNRAGAMINAKPRMLTNLDWLDTRDDLRILRSIKYGVPGTSMMAWGDQTNSIQRMQLLMFIRSLSEEAKARERLMQNIYQTYSRVEFLIEKYRAKEFPKIADQENALDEVKAQLATLDNAAKLQKINPQEAVEQYKKELLLSQKLAETKKNDSILQQLLKTIKLEKVQMTELGLSLIAVRKDGVDFDTFLKILNLEENRFSIEEDTIQINSTPSDEIDSLKQKLIQSINVKIDALEKINIADRGKIQSSEIKQFIKERELKIKNMQDLKNKINSALEENIKLEYEQKQLIENLSQRTLYDEV